MFKAIKKYLFVFLPILCGFWQVSTEGATGAVWAASGTVDDPYHVYMVLWRGETDVEKGFLDYFRERGISVKATIRNFERNTSKAQDFIAEARALKPDLIYTWGTSGTLAIRGPHNAPEAETSQYLTEIPGVFTLVSYPIEAGIIPDYENTERNLTGVLFLAPVEAQIGAINAYLAPDKQLKRLGAIYNSAETNARINIELLQKYAEAAGIELFVEAVPIITVNEEGRVYDKPDTAALPRLVEKLSKEDVDFLYIGADSYLTRRVKELSQAVTEFRMPAFVATEAPIKAERSDMLLSLTTPYYNLGQLTAYQAEQILRGGIPPRRLSVLSLREFNILLNRYAMRRLEYFPPLDLLLDATFIDHEPQE